MNCTRINRLEDLKNLSQGQPVEIFVENQWITGLYAGQTNILKRNNEGQTINEGIVYEISYTIPNGIKGRGKDVLDCYATIEVIEGKISKISNDQEDPKQRKFIHYAKRRKSI